MKCLHPFTRKYKDALTGEMKECLCPCGHCINCLHAYQDMWSIRLGEAAKYYKSMVYDTYTIRPDKMIVKIDFTKPTKSGTLYGSTETYRQWKVNAFMKSYDSFKRYYPHISFDSWKILKKTGFKVYHYPKEEVQKWFKRGREEYYRAKGYRPDITYFLSQEYGPETSRPHFHILFFGITYADYMTYWGNPWRDNIGWTKPVFKCYGADTVKDFNNMVRYVSKYVSKGVFESPFVLDGLQEKPYKLISKGIGAGYLLKDFFTPFKNPEFIKWMDFHKPSDQQYYKKLGQLEEEGDMEKIKEYKKYFKKCSTNIAYALANKEYLKDTGEVDNNMYIDLSSITPEVLKKIQIYYDSNGYPHALPQYYKNKLFRKNNEKNIYQLEIQNLLEQSARLHDNQVIQREALDLGVVIPDDWLTEDSFSWKLSPSTLFMVQYNHLVKQRSQAQTRAERLYARLKNTYNRGKMNLQNPACA